MADKYGTTQDPYTYENSTVLVNKLNIRNEIVLEAAERDLTTLAAMYVEFQLPPYDFSYLRQFITFCSPIYLNGLAN